MKHVVPTYPQIDEVKGITREQLQHLYKWLPAPASFEQGLVFNEIIRTLNPAAWIDSITEVKPPKRDPSYRPNYLGTYDSWSWQHKKLMGGALCHSS